MRLTIYFRALGDRTFRPTAIRVALFVGTVHFCINHGVAVLNGTMTSTRWLAAAITYCVPYCVNIHGQLVSRLRAEAEAAQESSQADPQKLTS
ncbi:MULTISPECIES: nitrate/nitrite transporter NrtS2 [Cyanophyceae]|uniref:nitrate/nitrite transporter NrtS2 n=1 Tax=Cyanophyceae TaxID=3028117 RepID=UPI00016DC4FD|nr:MULTISPECIES: nitrate/nitrite transporter NrtS2 [Cyanophyceae]ACA98022.1 conserved hypothetical protein [Picosynechococcus sp. PCC 7002]ANV89162.1 hypothetical protein AWQ24_00020 [Picosynechococcus sp. PCC 8807]SMH47605.1 alkylhydroperoxidase AhpD family core domain-containing protein [Picosynechococcus sp. OG1]SMQ81043.1 alkylhydroperoxidase AhpD family core domain-containing protein [Synechococcus sp. 7002]